MINYFILMTKQPIFLWIMYKEKMRAHTLAYGLKRLIS